MTTRMVIALLLALFVTSSAHADGPSEAESIARFDRAVETGHFVVLSGHGITLAIIGSRGAAQPHALVFDIDGDGTLEILLSDFLDDGDVTLFTLPLDGTALVPVGGFGINYNIGC